MSNPSPTNSERGEAPLAYRVTQVGKLLSLPKSTVYDLVRTGRLRSVQVGRIVLVPASELKRLLSFEPRLSGKSSSAVMK
jgi:excisionase family DNA binding protein